MERYIVKESDLIGDIENLPIGLAQLMVDYQFIQGNEPDIEVFQRCKISDKYDGGLIGILLLKVLIGGKKYLMMMIFVIFIKSMVTTNTIFTKMVLFVAKM